MGRANQTSGCERVWVGWLLFCFCFYFVSIGFWCWGVVSSVATMISANCSLVQREDTGILASFVRANGLGEILNIHVYVSESVATRFEVFNLRLPKPS